jgi:hypothetical protein
MESAADIFCIHRKTAGERCTITSEDNSTAICLEKPFMPVALADVAKDEGLWLHVDGAYGASIALSDKHRHLVDGSR